MKDIRVLDGAMGSVLAGLRLREEDFRGRMFPGHGAPLRGNFDVLSLTRPDLVAAVHRAYLEAGADIIETNTFSANAIAQARYGLADRVAALNLAAARLALGEARRAEEATGRPRRVAGAMGPTPVAASAAEFRRVADALGEQAAALIRGGVDMLLIETLFDVGNARAAVEGIARARAEAGREVPVAFSATVDPATGRLPSGDSLEAFVEATAPAGPVALGLNCCAGPEGLAGPLRRLADAAPCAVMAYPSAGIPDARGRYPASPEDFAAALAPLVEEGRVCIVGGCCGTTPRHIAELRRLVDGAGQRATRPPSTR